MKPINIYILTRIDDTHDQSRLERQMSGRGRFLNIKEWETNGLKTVSDRLSGVMEKGTALKFFYSFTMPKLGKEFDLLRISSDSVVNIELKSGNVSDEAIKRQLEQNRYYLSTLDRAMYSYTYISEDDRIVRLSGGGRLIDTTWEELAETLEKQQDCYEGNIEDLFREDRYLISPLTDPLRFLRGDYFLTSQQRDIRNQILKDITEKPGVIRRKAAIHGFTGLPGTGKTILLYDIAMQLSESSRVCILHFGSHEKELEHLDERLKRIDFHYCDANAHIDLSCEYSAILVDEGHRLSAMNVDEIMAWAKRDCIPVVISYDREDTIAYEERNHDGSELIEKIPGFNGYKLTNRIRLNSELSAFITRLMFTGGSHRRDFPSVSAAFAPDGPQTDTLLKVFIDQGYIHIYDDAMNKFGTDRFDIRRDSEVDEGSIEVSEATCREFNRVVMVLDDSFTYAPNGYLRSVPVTEGGTLPPTVRADGDTEHINSVSVVRNLFHGLSRAKERIAIIVKGNKPVFETILMILQGEKR